MPSFNAVVARGLESFLAEELVELGVREPVARAGVVAFDAPLALAYRVLLAARLPSRLLFPLVTFEGASLEAMVEAVGSVPWHEHVRPDGRLVVDVARAASVSAHTRYVAQRTKDVICDQLRARTGTRPSVDAEHPDIRVHVHLGDHGGTVSLDLATRSLHRRGYRTRGAAAPLKENLAAALLRIAGVRPRLLAGEPLYDPMCGTGTLLVEAALDALDVAPGLMLRDHGVTRWLGHDRSAFDRVHAELRARADAARGRKPVLVGFDASEACVDDLRRLAESLALPLRAEVRRIDAAAPLGAEASGLVVTNPPYGERLGAESELVFTYESLGDVLRRRFTGFDAYVLTSSKVLAGHLGLAARARHVVFNGPIECRFLHFPISAEAPRAEASFRAVHPESEAFRNRLRKNVGTIGKRAAREGLEFYRLYDADVPEYNVAVDRVGPRVVVEEYAAPRHVDPALAARRLRDAVVLVAEELGVPRESIHLAVRRRQTGGAQYERGEQADVVLVKEGPATFELRLGEHLDPGLFGDLRKLRASLAAEAAGKRFLNLFAYTCSASVRVALADGRTTSVDLSARYLGWGQRNFRHSGLRPEAHEFVEADVRSYLRHERRRFDVVLLNPPSYSRARRVGSDFSVVRDHVPLIEHAMDRVEPSGSLTFVTHARGFRLDDALRERFEVGDLSPESVPFDHVRGGHQAYRLRHRQGFR